MSAIVYRFSVCLRLELDGEFTQENAESVETQRDLERRLYHYLQGWRSFPRAADVELLEYAIEPTKEDAATVR